MKRIITALVLLTAITVTAQIPVEQVIPLWGEIDPGVRITAMRLRTEADMESGSRKVKEEDGTYSVALVRRMVEIIPITATGTEYEGSEYRNMFSELKVTQTELIAAGLACDPQITWLGSYGSDSALVIKRAMVTKVGVLMGAEGQTLSAWVTQVMAALSN